MTREQQTAPTIKAKAVKAVNSQRDGQAVYKAELDQYLKETRYALSLERLEDIRREQ